MLGWSPSAFLLSAFWHANMFTQDNLYASYYLLVVLLVWLLTEGWGLRVVFTQRRTPWWSPSTLLIRRFEETPIAFLTSLDVELQVHEVHMAWHKAVTQMRRLYSVNMCDGSDHKNSKCPLNSKISCHFFSQTFIEKFKAYTGSVFRRAVSRTNGGCGPHLPPEPRMFSSQI